MFKWQGAAGICINDKKEILMVLQAAPDEEKKWTVPSGRLKMEKHLNNVAVESFGKNRLYNSVY